MAKFKQYWSFALLILFSRLYEEDYDGGCKEHDLTRDTLCWELGKA